MASMTMTASFLAGAVQPVSAPRRGLIVAKSAARAVEAENAGVEVRSITAKAEGNANGRRDLVFAAATAAVAAFAGAAFADEEDEEPKRGTAEAKKKYSTICVTMPTARICHK